jgi:asparagine synthase (glutamine-hydrolysing)
LASNVDLSRKRAGKISHRGPDNFGEIVNLEDNYYLSHFRLSIIDLSSRSNQPITCKSSGSELIYNGEIYNLNELASRLRSLGINPQSESSDTQILLDCLVHLGVKNTLENLDGMFAFLFIHKPSSTVYFARDHIGIKPIYFRKDNKSISIASEAKALACYTDISSNPDLEFEFFYRRFISNGDTFYSNVDKLEPGSVASFNLHDYSTLKISKYWSPLSKGPPIPSIKGTNHGQVVSNILNNSVRQNLLSDVSLGLFLSSGIDSMSIAVYASSLNLFSDRYPLQSITGNVPTNKKYSEDYLVRKTLNELNLSNVNLHTTPFQDYNHDQYERLAYQEDHPSFTTISSAIDCLYREASNLNIKVILSGEGADELFIGYHSWKKALMLKDALRSPISSSLSAIERFTSSDFREVMLRTSEGRPIFWGGSQGLTIDEMRYAFDIPQSSILAYRDNYYHSKVEPHISALKNNGFDIDGTHAMTYLDLNARLPELILNRADKIGMMHSIEGRFPYLSRQLADYIFSVPSDCHRSILSTKPLLRKSLTHAFPSRLWKRKKWGLRLPKAKSTQLCNSALYIRENIHLLPWPLKNDVAANLESNSKLTSALTCYLHWRIGVKKYA